jgi:hypothetical protein
MRIIGKKTGMVKENGREEGRRWKYKRVKGKEERVKG